MNVLRRFLHFCFVDGDFREMSGLNNLLVMSGEDVDVEPLSTSVPDFLEHEEDDEMEEGDGSGSSGELPQPGSLAISQQPLNSNDFDDFLKKKQLASDLKDQFMTTGCPNIDQFLNGGIIRSGLTEIVGPSAVGKTQIALQLSITAQLPEELGGLGLGTSKS